MHGASDGKSQGGSGMEPGFEPGGAKLKTIFFIFLFFMKIKTNTYFIFNKILHIK